MNDFIFENTSGIYHKFDQIYSDLEFDQIVDKIDRTITTFGKTKLRNRIKCVVSNPDDLQKIIDLNQIVAVDDLFKSRMRGHLLRIKQKESILTRWMKSKPDIQSEESKESKESNESKGSNEPNENENLTVNENVDGLNKNADADMYFKKGTVYNPLNMMNNRYMLTASNRFVMSSVLIVIMIYVFIYLYMYWLGFPISVPDYLIGIYEGYKFFCGFLLMQIMTNIDWIEMGAMILALTYVGYQIYTTYKSVMICVEHYYLCSDFCDRYEKVCDFIDDVSKMLDQDLVVKKLDSINETKIASSIEYLKSYFTKGSSLGYSLVSQISTSDYVSHLNTLVNYVGKIDMLIAVSELVNEGYTLPMVNLKRNTFNKSYDFPVLSAVGIWNPILGIEKSVKNSLRVDSRFPNVVILTGPNKAGKSTFMKTLMVVVYMAQTLGICPSQNLFFTPFRDLFTYLNVPDAIGRESLFEAEVNRCHAYLKASEKLRGFSLGIIDELFTGTNPKEGMAGSYAILNQIARIPINITVISTHFLDMIEELDKSNFTFMKFNCTILTNISGRKIHRFDYRLKPGTSDQMIALSLLEEKGFDDKIIDDAFRFVNNIKRNNIKNKMNSREDGSRKYDNDDDNDDNADENNEKLVNKVRELLGSLDNDDNAENTKISQTNPFESQLTKALEYSKSYNMANGLPAVLRR